MTSKEAKDIAGQYADDMGEILPGFKFGISEGEEFIREYYFDFIWKTVDSQEPEEYPLMGGAIGFTVNKYNKQVDVLSHGRYFALKEREHQLTEIYQLLLDFKSGKKNLAELKDRFNLNSVQVHELSRVIKDTDLKKENIYEVLAGLPGK